MDAAISNIFVIMSIEHPFSHIITTTFVIISHIMHPVPFGKGLPNPIIDSTLLDPGIGYGLRYVG